MSYNSSRFKSLAHVIEEILSIPLRRKEIEKYEPSPHSLHELALAVRTYYTDFQIPPKDPWSLRPYIFVPGMPPFGSLGMNYVFDYPSTVSGTIALNVKKYLLYCHGICN